MNSTKRVSWVICGVLGLQALAVLSRVDAYGFPFVDYPMYSGIRREGQRMDRPTVVAHLADGKVVRVTPADVGLDEFQYGHWTAAIGRRERALAQPQGAPAPLPSALRQLLRDVNTGANVGALLARKLRPPFVDRVDLFVNRYEERAGVRVTALQLEENPNVITRTGLGRVDEVLLSTPISLVGSP